MRSSRSRFLRRRRGLWLALVLVLSVAFAVPAVPAAEQAEAWPEPRFPIQEVRVEGLDRASETIVLAESRLHAGAAYSEAELRRAVYRVVRLPFVLDADFRLEKGDERGTYRLVVAVVESKRFFFNREAEYALYASTLAERAARTTEDDLLHRGAAGARLFLGRRGELFAAVGLRETFQAGYNHYDLFGRGAVAGVAVSRSSFCCETRLFSLGLVPDLATWNLDEPERLTLHLTVPLADDRSFVAAYSTVRSAGGDEAQLAPGGGGALAAFHVLTADVVLDRLDLRSVRDTSDDPLFPTRGRRVDVGVDLQRLRRDGDGFFLRTDSPPFFDVLPLDVRLESRMARLSVGGERHLPLGSRQAVTVGGRAAVGLSDAETLDRKGAPVTADLEVYEASVHGAHRVRLWQHPDPQVGELWWETRAEVAWEGTSDGDRFAANPVTRSQVGVSLAFRNAWGLFKLGLSVFDLEGVD